MIINVTDIQIIDWKVSVVHQNIKVRYKIVTDTGDTYQIRDAWFWITLPENPTVDDYLLPEAYVETLTNITNDARSALLPTIQ